MSNSHTPKNIGNHLTMTVQNVGFLLERLGQDCSPLQYLRELTHNGLQAIERMGETGEVIWDVDWISFDLGEPMRLCIIDTGDGMTGEEMLMYINQLSSSGSEQSITANYGIGAKIAAATQNPAGLVYQSWKDGEGYMIQLHKDPKTGEYGLQQWLLDDGTYSHYMQIEEYIKPPEIKQNGTKVILYGKYSGQNSMDPPKGAPSPSRWISKYLNTRYFKFPECVSVRAREGWDNPRDDKDRNLLRTITGQKPYLDKHSVSSGISFLEGAKLYWWILKDEPAVSNNSGYIESGGHVAALYQNELYDRVTARAGTAQLQLFGILFGSKFVVLYIEPTNEKENLTTNTARTTLLLNGEPLPWAEWAYEFREKMPSELADFVKNKSAGTPERDHVKSIKERLKGIMDLYKVSRYKPSPQGTYLSDDSSKISVGTPIIKRGSPDNPRESIRNVSVIKRIKEGRDGSVGNIYHLFEKKGGQFSDRVETDPFPVVNWVSIEDGTRDEGDMEDKAAKYLSEQNTLLVNADFRVFKDMVLRLCKEKDTKQGLNIESVVEDVVHSWFEQALIETVIGVQQLKGSKEWGADVLKRALSEETLTATVLQRYHIHIACRRELGAKLGRAIKNVDV